jgi:hypothetical protein
MYHGRNPALSYTLSFERERLFPEKLSVTHGPRLDFSNAERSTQPPSSGWMLLVLGYQFKYYPFAILRKKPMRGFFLGINPSYAVKVRDQYPYGPGVGFLMGYQVWIKNAVTLGLELNVANGRNVNQNIAATTPGNWFWDGIFAFKIGYQFGKRN